jgi:TetR/AcrR family transcriptional regulator, repressor of fatR-cypB operon
MNVHPLKRTRGRPRTGGKREDILDAALGLFAERGFHGTAMPDIAAEAGIAAGTIYRHFTGKETLVNELYRRSKQALLDALLADLPTATLRAQFHHLWWSLVRFAREQPRAFAFLELHHHGSYLDAESRAIEMRVLVPIAKVLELGRARGVIKSMPPQALIVTVWGAFVGMIKAARLGYYQLTDAICTQVEETCWDAIRNPHAQPEPQEPR